jgi:hypothetical protein
VDKGRHRDALTISSTEKDEVNQYANLLPMILFSLKLLLAIVTGLEMTALL